MFAKKDLKKPLTKHRKETLRSVLFAARATYNNGESNCCAGTLTPDCYGNGSPNCCNGK